MARNFTPKWTKTAPGKGTYRSIFKWGAPEGFKHPNRRLYEMIKEKFGMTDEDFKKKTSEGNEKVQCKNKGKLSAEQIGELEKNSR